MRRTTLSLVVLCVAAAALLGAGCGVGSSPEQKVSEATDDYLRSLAGGEHDTACAQLTFDAKARIAGPCVVAMREIAARVGSDELLAAAEAGVEIDVAGDRATVTIPELAGVRLTLEPRGARWRISDGYDLG